MEDYLRVGTLDKGEVSAPLSAIARDVGMSSATVHRAIKALQDRGVVTVSSAKRPGLPQSLTYLPAGGHVADDVVLRRKLNSIRVALSELEVEINNVIDQSRALHEETAIYRERDSRIESRAELEDGRELSL